MNFESRALLQRIRSGFPRLGGEEEPPIEGPPGPPGPPGPGVTGMIYMWGGDSNSIPSDYLFCDGRAVSRVTYSALFAKVKTYYGAGDGVNTFNLPFIHVGTFPRATAQSIGNNFIPGFQGGTSTHTHPVSIGSSAAGDHYHTFSIFSGGQHNHDNHGFQSNIAAQGNNTVLNSPTGAHVGDGSHDHGGGGNTSQSVFGDHAHGVIGNTQDGLHTPPHLDILFVIKT